LWRFVRVIVVAGLGLLVLIRFADLAAQASLGRPFNWLLDIHLAAASFDLLAGAIGRVRAAAWLTAAALAWIASMVLVDRAIGALRLRGDGRRRATGAAAIVAAVI